jgi:hypothetical protein
MSLGVLVVGFKVALGFRVRLSFAFFNFCG